ncbi:hypothetical protein NIG5292_02770 [Nereida ignava]|uniref:Uncharacterized protein n=1 Tax=Nereida ignava TaxID=282199 RepID=A0A0U1NPN9_9RHOB|nr:hypothetical protein [Nereida ignava]CRK76705.1 hypothetical protein NIG5292_02770 [Nereida ignava]SFJ91779.1 hypothetical protein SAMN02745667_02759 [Nereida ignava DSM 16309]
MEKSDVEELRSGVPCAAVLERAGFAVDRKESTKRAVKFRRGDEIIIVICLGPLKLCHYLLTKGVTENGTETVFT